MATRTDSEHRIREELDWLGCRPAGSFRIERAQHENQFIAAATAGRLRPIVTSWHLIYAEPDGGRQIVCAAFGYEELAVEILDILSGRLTSPNLGGYGATSRVPLTGNRRSEPGGCRRPRRSRAGGRTPGEHNDA